MAKVLVLVDGEHYPAVTRWGIDVARSQGDVPLAAVLVGGKEKLPGDDGLDLGDVAVETAPDLAIGLADAIARHRPDEVLDLSDEPVLGPRERLLAASVALAKGVAYRGPGFRFDPPAQAAPLPVPTVAVIGTGKRTGKTAVGGHVARVAAAAGYRPVVVAMGRGGPPEPETADVGPDLDRLRELLDQGRHAASDYLEDALTAGVPTVGARRCGGGPIGEPFSTNVADAAERAVASGAGTVVLEGSGSAIPPVPWDGAVLVAPAALDPELLTGYFGAYRLLRSDLVCLTMVSGPDVGPENLSTLRSHVRRLRPDARVVLTDFIATPLGDVEGKRVFLVTTATATGVDAQVSALREHAGAEVVGASGNLADRSALRADLDAAPEFDVLATELKAAAIDVAADVAERRGAEVVFVDNRPVGRGGDGELDALILELFGLAGERAADRRSGEPQER